MIVYEINFFSFDRLSEDMLQKYDDILKNIQQISNKLTSWQHTMVII